MVERIQVQSRSPFEIHHILTGLENTPETVVECELYLPQGEGPFGCVIALHGSLGWGAHHNDHVNAWLDAGLAVCKVNSFISRSIESTVNDQLSVTHAMMLVDAFRTRSALEQDPRIGKIGIAGWSLGGTVALYSAWAPLVDLLGAPFDAHVPFYPAAHLRPEVQDWSTSPMLILHGLNCQMPLYMLIEGHNIPSIARKSTRCSPMQFISRSVPYVLRKTATCLASCSLVYGCL